MRRGPKDPPPVADYINLVVAFRNRLKYFETNMTHILTIERKPGAAKKFAKKYLKEVDEDFQEIEETFEEVGWGAISGMHPAPEKVEPNDLRREQEAMKQKLLDIRDAFALKLGERPEEEVEEPAEEEEEEEEEFTVKEVQAEKRSLAAAYMVEWRDYVEVLKGQVLTMEPFELLKHPKKELKEGSVEEWAEKFQEDRDEMLKVVNANWKQANAQKIPKDLLGDWTEKSAGVKKRLVDTKIRTIMDRRKIIRKGREGSPQLNVRLELIQDLSKRLGHALVTVLASFQARRVQDSKTDLKFRSLAKILDDLFRYDPVRRARRLLRRLRKEVKRTKRTAEKKKKPQVLQEKIEETLTIVKKAAAEVSKKRQADEMNLGSLHPETLEREENSVRDSVNLQMNGQIKAINDFVKKMGKIDQKVDFDAQYQQAAAYMDKVRDLFEVATHPSYRLFGYDPSNEELGINSKKREKEVSALATRIEELQNRLDKANDVWAVPIVLLPIKKRIKKVPEKVVSPSASSLSLEEDDEENGDEEEEEQLLSAQMAPICDVMPTLANAVVPSARYETVRIQLRRRAIENAGVTRRSRTDIPFVQTDSLRVKYPSDLGWPVNDLAAGQLDAEIYWRVFGRQKITKFQGKGFKENLLSKPINDQAKMFRSFLKTSQTPEALRASMGMRTFAGTPHTKDMLETEIEQRRVLDQDTMSYVFKVYLSANSYDNVAIADADAWHEARTRIVAAEGMSDRLRGRAPLPNIPSIPAWWISSEIFSYLIPSEALPLGTPASDTILRRCGIEMVLVVLNHDNVHWSTLAYPLRADSKNRGLYHYDSSSDKSPAGVAKLMNKINARFFDLGLFDPSIAQHIIVPKGVKGCPRQRDGWSCGYVSMTMVDAIARKTASNPGIFLDDPTLFPFHKDDLPSSPLGDATSSILNVAKKWGTEVALETVWKWVQPGGVADFTGYPDPRDPFIELRAPYFEAEKYDIDRRTTVGTQPAEKKEVIFSTSPYVACVSSVKDRSTTKRNQDVWTAWDLGDFHTLYAIFDGHDSLGTPLPDAGRQVAQDLADGLPKKLWEKLHKNAVETNPWTDQDRRTFQEAVTEAFQEFDEEKFVLGVDNQDEVPLKDNPWFQGGSTVLCVLVTSSWVHMINLGDSRAFITNTNEDYWDFVIAQTQDMRKEKTKIRTAGMGDFAARAAFAGSLPDVYPGGGPLDIITTIPQMDPRDAKREKYDEPMPQAMSRSRRPGDYVVLMSDGAWEKQKANSAVGELVRKGINLRRGKFKFERRMCGSVLDDLRLIRPAGFGGDATIMVINTSSGVNAASSFSSPLPLSSSPPVPRRLISPPSSTTTNKTYVGRQSGREKLEEEMANYMCEASDKGKDSRGRTLRSQSSFVLKDMGNDHFLYLLVDTHGPPSDPYRRKEGLRVAYEMSAYFQRQFRDNKVVTKKVVTNPSTEDERKAFKKAVQDAFVAFDKEEFRNMSEMDRLGRKKKEASPWWQTGATAVGALVTPDWIHLFNLGDPRAIVIGKPAKTATRNQVVIATKDNQVTLAKPKGIKYPGALMGLFGYRSSEVPLEPNEYPGLSKEDPFYPVVHVDPQQGKLRAARPDTRTFILMGTQGFWRAFPGDDGNQKAMKLVLRVIRGRKRMIKELCKSILEEMRKTKEGSKLKDGARIILIDVTPVTKPTPRSSITGSISLGRKSVTWIQCAPENFW